MKQRVLITGTTSGIGRGLMTYYQNAGWEVIAFNRRQDQDLESALPSVRFMHVDVRNREAIRNYFKSAYEQNELPELYYLNAGINKADHLNGFSIEMFQEVMEINLTGVLNFVDAALPYLSGKKAVFVAASSSSIIFPNPKNIGYYASKLCEANIFKMLDARYRKEGLRFKALILSPIATNIFTGGTLQSKFQSRLRNFLTVQVEDAIPKIVRFVHSPRRVFYYTKTAVLVFFLAALIKKIIPSFYQGAAQNLSQAIPDFQLKR